MSVLHASDRSQVGTATAELHHANAARQQRAGGVAAVYLAAAYLVAMPYFLIVVDYPSLTTPPRRWPPWSSTGAACT